MSRNAFAAGLLDPDSPAPRGLIDGKGRRAGRRYDVYRNNVTVGLCDALEVAFPTLRALVGEAFFRAMAQVFVSAHPPASPLMMFYGGQMPGFLEGFAPVAHLPYLPDVARLELALRESYHAADADPVDPAALAALPSERLGDLRLQLAPALRLVRSAHPVGSIHRAHAEPVAPPPAPRAEAVLILRPGYDPELHLIEPDAATFVAALIEGRTLGAALDTAGEGFAPGPTLGLLLGGDAITALIPGELS
ncbi:MAG: DUF2063 domain-containing protein [Limimaricola sp.]|uniref:HvfC/BufC N-terminal domain-containing protein n=1 Tax=Limimaricola sp. TaxID=2211665 RepID=UPI001E159D91|nr:DNA-binding domain-containing protein [Limimaricola sp.]MBI1416515.1 DUF2063 domain-containing protein [Limimaricola sp.]